MDYFIANALEIMYLSLGGGFLILVIVVSRFLLTVQKTVKKVNYFADSVELYVQKPLKALAQINDYVTPVLGLFSGEKKK